MSKRLTLSATLSVLMMSAFVLFGAPVVQRSEASPAQAAVSAFAAPFATVTGN